MHSSNAGSPEQIILSQISLADIYNRIRTIVREEIVVEKIHDLQEKMLSPSETCKLFNPKISLVTLDSWAGKGLLIKHYIGGRTYYKYSQVLNSLKTLKRYHIK